MNKLEDRIIKKMYECETVDVCMSTGTKLILLCLAGFFTVSVGAFAIGSMFDRKLFDLFALFFEDFETIRMYFGDVLYIFYTETPKLYLFLALVSLAVFILLIFSSVSYIKKATCKFKSVFRFWFAH